MLELYCDSDMKSKWFGVMQLLENIYGGAPGPVSVRYGTLIRAIDGEQLTDKKPFLPLWSPEIVWQRGGDREMRLKRGAAAVAHVPGMTAAFQLPGTLPVEGELLRTN